MSVNPYSVSPADIDNRLYESGQEDQLAGRFTRFAAVLADGFFLGIITVPVQIATGYVARSAKGQTSWLESLAMSLFGLGAFLLLNGYLLAKRGQTIGKMLTKIQIVSAEDGGLLSFLRVYAYRYLWLLPLLIVVLLIPGDRDNLLVSVAVLVDSVLIFGSERRCLHDRIAGSKVVKYVPGRERSE